MGRAPARDRRPQTGSNADLADLLAFYQGKIAKWWMPDDVLFVDELPHGATGKLLKTKLRELYGNHVATAAIGRGMTHVERCRNTNSVSSYARRSSSSNPSGAANAAAFASSTTSSAPGVSQPPSRSEASAFSASFMR